MNFGNHCTSATTVSYR